MPVVDAVEVDTAILQILHANRELPCSIRPLIDNIAHHLIGFAISWYAVDVTILPRVHVVGGMG